MEAAVVIIDHGYLSSFTNLNHLSYLLFNDFWVIFWVMIFGLDFDLSVKNDTVIPRYLAPRYLANLASRHTKGRNGFPSMLITPLSPC